MEFNEKVMQVVNCEVFDAFQGLQLYNVGKRLRR